MSLKDERLASLLTQLAASFIAHEAGRKTLITPTRTKIGNDHRATIFVSVFPDSEIEHALHFLERSRPEFLAFIKKEARLKFLPSITFAFDSGEQNRQHLDELSKEIGGPSGN